MGALWCTACYSPVGVFHKARVGTSLGFRNDSVIHRRKLDSSDCSCQRDTKPRIDRDRNLVYGHKLMGKCVPCPRSKLGRTCAYVNRKIDSQSIKIQIRLFTFHTGVSCCSVARTILLPVRSTCDKESFFHSDRNGSVTLMKAGKAGRGQRDKGRCKSEDSPKAHKTWVCHKFSHKREWDPYKFSVQKLLWFCTEFLTELCRKDR